MRSSSAARPIKGSILPARARATTETSDSITATVVKGAIVLSSAGWCEGELILTTTCRDYDHFASLPDVVSYRGVECGKTGWSSDTMMACYKQGATIAHKVR